MARSRSRSILFERCLRRRLHASGKSRWSGKQRVPVPLEPVLVVEVSADHITGDHMRHGARLLRWRTDKNPESCTMDQIR
jgi:ATP-dependent DNA ligase